MSSLTLLASINVASTLAHLITHLVVESVFASKKPKGPPRPFKQLRLPPPAPSA